MNKILFITAYPINNKTAGQNYSLKLLDDLSFDYKIDIIYWNYHNHETKIDNNNLTIMKSLFTNSIYKTLFYSIKECSFPLFSVRYNKDLAEWIKENHHKYDFVYFDFSQTFIYSKYVSNSYKIMMCHDIIAQKYQRKNFSFIYNWFVRMTERKFLKDGNSIFSFSTKDQQLLSELYGIKSDIVSFYIGNDILNVDFGNIELEDYFVFYGAWNRKENSDGLRWFLKNVYPSCTDMNIKIIGGSLEPDIRKTISRLNKIEYVGFIDNPYDIIAKSNALIAPIFSGAGVKVKVIETLALGTPIIGTDIAFEGIENMILEGRAFLEKANNKKEFIDRIHNFKRVTQLDKSKVKAQFLKNYNKRKFSEIIKTLF